MTSDLPGPSGRRPPTTVTVAVVTYNSAEDLPGLLEALPDAMQGIEEWELVVADNASTDGTPDLVRRLAPEAKLVETGRNGGYAAGINAALAESRDFDAVLVSNADIRPTPGCVRVLAEVLSDPGVGIAVPRLVGEQGQLLPSLRREPSVLRMVAEAVIGGRRAGRGGRLGEVVYEPTAYERENIADWAAGAFMLISRDCRRAIGPWDESYFLYSEETDYAIRAREAGFLLRYTPRATVVHLEGDASVSPFLYTLQIVNRHRFYARGHGALASALFFTALVLREAIRCVRGGATHRSALRALLLPSSRPREVRAP